MDKYISKYIPYGKQWIDQNDINEVIDILNSDYLTTGPKIAEFETAIANVTGAKYSVAVSNGTAALHAACAVLDLKEGDEIITSPITFAASANCALYVSAKPIFADIDPYTYNIDPEDIKKRITEKTKAIIPVHFTGQPCDMDKILKIAEEYELFVIQDAAHALGAKHKDRAIGELGDMATFSFHPVKHITTGEGGAITTNNKELYEKLKLFRSHGITRDKDILVKPDQGSWYYEQQMLGYNYRMTDIQAALGISQLSKLDKYVEIRRCYAAIYDEAFKDIEQIIIPAQYKNTNSSWHLYIIKLRLELLKVDRKVIFDEFINRNIGVNVHYIPVYYHPYYQRLGYEKGLCPIAEDLYERIITLPLYPKMEEADIRYIIDNVLDIVNKYSL